LEGKNNQGKREELGRGPGKVLKKKPYRNGYEKEF